MDLSMMRVSFLTAFTYSQKSLVGNIPTRLDNSIHYEGLVFMIQNKHTKHFHTKCSHILTSELSSAFQKIEHGCNLILTQTRNCRFIIDGIENEINSLSNLVLLSQVAFSLPSSHSAPTAEKHVYCRTCCIHYTDWQKQEK